MRGIDRVRDILLDNTERFAAGLPANNVLLWGARGTGKSSLVKAAHAAVNETTAAAPWRSSRSIAKTSRACRGCCRCCGGSARRCLLFCDDLSFDQHDASYKSLKAVLEGGIEGRPGNVVLYATSNRRHLMPRDMIENERSTAINPAEAVEEKVSLSDRFGLWLGFHNLDQDTYQAIVRGYAAALRARPAGRAAQGRGQRMVDHPRLALRPRRLAIHPGPRRPARQAARLIRQ